MTTKDLTSITKCRLCLGNSLETILNLGLHPLANSLLESSREARKKYPLTLLRCKNCSLVQIRETVNPKILFSRYVWVTGTSKQATDFAPVFAKELRKRAPKKPDKSHFVVELASNDGTFLKPFITQGLKTLGIDPAKNIAEIARRQGVPTEAVFFNQKSANIIAKKYGQATMVFARNVLAHVVDMNDFLLGARDLLAEDGVIAIEPHDARHILEGLQYDSIYHEHLCYFTLRTLEKALKENGLYVFDAIRSPVSGGAIIVYASKIKKSPTRNLIARRSYEKKHGTNSIKQWRSFASLVKNHGSQLKKILENFSRAKIKVAGWGASARSSTLLNFCGINREHISQIADLNPLKHDKFTAGSLIPITPPDAMIRENPKVIIILGWNFAKEIIDTLKNKYHYHGKCILPLPQKPRVINL